MKAPRPVGGVSFDNRGRIAVVSGGSGGIGSAICRALLASGATGVVSVDQSPFPEPQPSDAARFLSVTADVSDPDACATAVALCVERFGTIDILVNTAAIQPEASYRPVHDLAPDLLRRVMEINVCGYAFMAQRVIPHMLQQQSGVIVNIASGQAHRTAREVPAYGPSKAANVLQTMQWGIEYARDGIRVVSVSPGTIDTPLVQASLAQQGGADELANRHPLGRIGTPNEVAQAVLWLSSGAASFVTATDLSVDGGLQAMGTFADPFPMDRPSASASRKDRPDQ